MQLQSRPAARQMYTYSSVAMFVFTCTNCLVLGRVACFTIDRRRPSNVVRAAVQELSQSLYSGSHIFACLFAYMFSVYCVQYIRAIKIYSISLLLYLQVIVRSQCNNSYLVCVLCCSVLTSSSLSLTTVTLDMLNKRKQ